MKKQKHFTYKGRDNRRGRKANKMLERAIMALSAEFIKDICRKEVK
ncbi:MAG: hypothetical protein UX75_C0036G0020 [Candidatus Moranbacteria bacterium GW2011_GWE2_47_10]|nr:MAG: hypothetical protein UX75_C0036G0020 [Candidatus Moranbacteria bacterium GW2011_GWE2_47_10]